MKSLKEVYASLTEVEKQAAAQENATPEQLWENLSDQEKLAWQQAQDYDQVGRILAHQVYDGLAKEAAAYPSVGHGEGTVHEDGQPCSPDCEVVVEYEKHAALRQLVLDKMASDPNYVAQLIAKHPGVLR